MVLNSQNRAGRNLHAVATPLRIDGQRPALRTPPPALGEHSLAILREQGYPDATVADWVAQGVVVDGSSHPA